MTCGVSLAAIKRLPWKRALFCGLDPHPDEWRRLKYYKRYTPAFVRSVISRVAELGGVRTNPIGLYIGNTYIVLFTIPGTNMIDRSGATLQAFAQHLQDDAERFVIDQWLKRYEPVVLAETAEQARRQAEWWQP